MSTYCIACMRLCGGGHVCDVRHRALFVSPGQFSMERNKVTRLRAPGWEQGEGQGLGSAAMQRGRFLWYRSSQASARQGGQGEAWKGWLWAG